MDSNLINKILNHNFITRKFFIGCYPCNVSPKIENFPSAFVMNLDKKDAGGSHWVGIFSINQNTAYYFDSFGEKPTKCIMENLPFKKIIHNPYKFQNIFTDVCGHYVIFVLHKMCQGLNFYSVIKLLKSVKNVDNFVKLYVSRFLQ